MITEDEVESAKALWEEVKIGHALALANWGMLEQSQIPIIKSLVALGFSHARAQAEFTKYREGHQQEVKTYALEMDKREKEYSELKSTFIAQQ
ncbi:TPA: hypothetical protein ACQTXI_003011 [Pseudomonas aeruginosa]